MEDAVIVRDQRTEERYFVDNIIVDKYGPILGPYGMMVYNIIVRHANPRGFGAFPSQATIARKGGMGIGTVKKCIGQLERLELIESFPRYRKDGGRTSNGFVVLNVPKTPSETECPWKGGIVYLAHYDGLTKIGCTKNLPARLAALENEAGESITVLGSVEVDNRWSKEAELHNRYRDSREYGEWFNLSDEQIKEAMTLLAAPSPPGENYAPLPGEATKNPPGFKNPHSIPPPKKQEAGQPPAKPVSVHRLLQATKTQGEDETPKSALAEYIGQKIDPVPSGQRNDLARPYTEHLPGGEKRKHPSPDELWVSHPRFPDWVEERIKWAVDKGGSAAAQRKRAVNAVCKYKGNEWAWLDWLASQEEANPLHRFKPVDDGPSQEDIDWWEREHGGGE